VTRELIAVTNTTLVNTETMCQSRRKIAASGLTGLITVVLNNARYQRNAVVQALASQLGITLLYLPSYLAQPELDRTAVEVCQTSCSLPLSSVDIIRI
jgi:hypothetical protein